MFLHCQSSKPIHVCSPWTVVVDIAVVLPEAAENPYGEDDSKSPFPVQPAIKRSYAQNVTVWIKASGLQVQCLPLSYMYVYMCAL